MTLRVHILAIVCYCAIAIASLARHIGSISCMVCGGDSSLGGVGAVENRFETGRVELLLIGEEGWFRFCWIASPFDSLATPNRLAYITSGSSMARPHLCLDLYILTNSSRLHKFFNTTSCVTSSMSATRLWGP
eukprot:scaffold15313_cov39-Cyclotella_meneghiniana.AAC.2